MLTSHHPILNMLLWYTQPIDHLSSKARQSTSTHPPKQTDSMANSIVFCSQIVQQCDHRDAQKGPRQPGDNLPYHFLRAQMLVKYVRLALTGVRAVPGLKHRWMAFLR